MSGVPSPDGHSESNGSSTEASEGFSIKDRNLTLNFYGVTITRWHAEVRRHVSPGPQKETHCSKRLATLKLCVRVKGPQLMNPTIIFAMTTHVKILMNFQMDLKIDVLNSEVK